MASVTQLRQALAESMSSIYGLRTSATMPDAPRPPVAVVMPDRIEYDLNANRGADSYVFVVTLIVGRADDRSAQNTIDGFIVGPDSIKAAIEQDRSLGGAANTCRVTEMRNYQQVQVGEVVYLGCEFEVEVWA